jgi:hypothetical protein
MRLKMEEISEAGGRSIYGEAVAKRSDRKLN